VQYNQPVLVRIGFLYGQLRNLLELSIGWKGVLATTHDIAPTAQNIEERLGAGSSAYKLDRATLATLYQSNRKNPTIAVKRKLWTQLLLWALGTQFKDDDDPFIDHTLLVNTSEIIAHAMLGLSVQLLTPNSLLSGEDRGRRRGQVRRAQAAHSNLTWHPRAFMDVAAPPAARRGVE
jgi:hypothetical protein